MFLNKSSTTNVLPSITRNETEMNNLREATIRIEKSEAAEPKIQPRILLLSARRETFKGLVLPTNEDEDLERRQNANQIRTQLEQAKTEKGNELYLEWLERNQENIDQPNKKMSLNIRANDEVLSLSNEKARARQRNNLSLRRYTTNASLQPPSLKPIPMERLPSFAHEEEPLRVRDDNSFSLPQIAGQSTVQQSGESQA